MSLKARSKIYKASGERRKSKYLLIPVELATDSQFPFKNDVEEVSIKIDPENKRLIVERGK